MSLIAFVFHWVLVPYGIFKLAQWLFRKAREKNKTIHLFYAVAIVIGSTTLWSIIPRAPTTPIFLPFDVQHARKTAETEINIKETDRYYFFLSFIYDVDIKGDRSRVKELVGEDKGIKRGIPTPFRLTIIKTKCPESGLLFGRCLGQALILEEEFENLQLRSWGGNNFDKYIKDMTLEKGGYLVRVESLKDIPELEGIRVRLSIYRPKS